MENTKKSPAKTGCYDNFMDNDVCIGRCHSLFGRHGLCTMWQSFQYVVGIGAGAGAGVIIDMPKWKKK